MLSSAPPFRWPDEVSRSHFQRSWNLRARRIERFGPAPNHPDHYAPGCRQLAIVAGGASGCFIFEKFERFHPWTVASRGFDDGDMKGLTAGAQSVSASELRRRQELSRGLAQDTANDASRFAEYDLDANRKLDFEEFHQMQPASVRAKHRREEIRKWFDAADDNGDGELSIEEFFKWSLHKASQKFGETTLNTVFEKFDKDRSGYLNAWEFEQAATEMGFGGVADHLFKSLDHDCSGTVTYAELIASLQAGTTEVDVETKTLLSSLLWTADVGVKSESNRSLKTAVDEVQGRDVPTVMYELREVLLKHGGQTIDLMKLFDDDATNEYIIDDMEFTKAMRTRFGFKGTKKLLDNVFKAIANGRRAGIGFDEFYEFVRGKKHSFDRRLKLTDDMRLLPPPGTTLDSLVWDVNTLLVLMQQMMARCNMGPMDIMRAWDVDENRQLSKPEFFGHVEALLDGSSRDLWSNEVALVAKQAYEHVAALGSGRSSADPRKQIDIVQLERWLNTPCDQPIAVKLRGSRQAMRNPPPTEEKKVRPRVDVAAKVRADIEAAAERAARAKEEYLAEERKDLDRFAKSRMPVQRWEVPPQLAPPPHPVFGSQRITLGSLKRWKEDNTKLGSSPEPEFSRTGEAEFALLPWARSLQRSHSHLVSPSASPIGGRKILSNLDVLARKSVSKVGPHKLASLTQSASTPLLDPLIDALESITRSRSNLLQGSGAQPSDTNPNLKKAGTPVILRPVTMLGPQLDMLFEEEDTTFRRTYTPLDRMRVSTPLWEVERSNLLRSRESVRALLTPMRDEDKPRDSKGRPQTPLWRLF